jgi:cytochrome c oxidase assembly factor CtaG
MPSSAQTLLQSWSMPIGVTCCLVIAAVFYVRGWLRLRAAFPNLIPVSRLIAFVSGLLAVWIAVCSPLEVFDDALLSAHMVQHLLLMAVAPPLLLLGAPVVPFLHGIPKVLVRGVLGPILRWRWIQWLGHTLTNPVLCLLAPSIALLGWHFPAAFELGLRSEWWHEVEHACFFITGIMLWWPVVQPWPSIARWQRWSIPLYLFFATLPCDALSAFLTFYDRVIYPSYLSAPELFGRSALSDQQFAGALMWLSVTFIYLFPAVMITIQILSPSHQPQKYGATETAKTPPIDESEFGVL